ncbi:MAG: VCBS repeat-containing protein [Planctomycetes bacterium]|nr:VCBS repeat-containing protein [Planctomycetota bacterium]
MGDLDRDGFLDAVVGSDDSKVYALSGQDGKPLWEFKTGGRVYSSPALGDLDGDSVLDAVVGSYDFKVCVVQGPLWRGRPSMRSPPPAPDSPTSAPPGAPDPPSSAPPTPTESPSSPPKPRSGEGGRTEGTAPAGEALPADPPFVTPASGGLLRAAGRASSLTEQIHLCAAHEAWQAVLNLASRDDPITAVPLARALLALGRVAEAIEPLRRAAAAFPRQVESRLLLALVSKDPAPLREALLIDPVRAYDAAVDLGLAEGLAALADRAERDDGRWTRRKKKRQQKQQQRQKQQQQKQQHALTGALRTGCSPGPWRSSSQSAGTRRGRHSIRSSRTDDRRSCCASGAGPPFGAGELEAALADWQALERVGGTLPREQSLIAEARKALLDPAGYHKSRAEAAIQARRFDEAFAAYERALEAVCGTGGLSARADAGTGSKLPVPPATAPLMNDYAWWLAVYTWPSETQPGEPGTSPESLSSVPPNSPESPSSPPQSGGRTEGTAPAGEVLPADPPFVTVANGRPAQGYGVARARRAVELAAMAVEKAPDAATRGLYRDTLAAALYASGEIDRAVAAGEEALREAEEKWHADMKARLEPYRRRRAR